VLLALTFAPQAAHVQAIEADPMAIWALEPLRGVPLDTQVLSVDVQDGARVEEVYFTSERIGDKAVRVYGFLARPTAIHRPIPGLIELHGGGGTASKSGAAGSCRLLGACVLSLDWSGDPKRAERVSIADALGDPRLFGDPRYVLEDLSDFSARHLIAAITRGVDLLLAQPEVDGSRIGVVGGSWGGFLAILAAGLDARLKCVASGFGAGGFRDTYSFCSRPLYGLTEAQREFWLEHVDPINHASRINGPVALLTASNEVHFWLSSAVATFRELPAGSRLIISPNTVHATGSGVVWPNHEWFRMCLQDGPAWPEIADFRCDGRRATWRVVSPQPITQSRLYFAPGAGNWPGRVWLPIAAQIVGDQCVAELPDWLAETEGDAYPLAIDDLRRSVSDVPVHVEGRSIRDMSEQRADPGVIDDFSAGADLWRLTLAARGSATLKWRKPAHGERGAMAVQEHRGQEARVAVETNLIALAAARLRTEGVLALLVDSAGCALDLGVELAEHPGQREERRFTVSVPVKAERGWQAIRVPLERFRDGDAVPDWSNTSGLVFHWSMPADCTVLLSNVRID
jgi:dienelactone hydrolase